MSIVRSLNPPHLMPPSVDNLLKFILGPSVDADNPFGQTGAAAMKRDFKLLMHGADDGGRNGSAGGNMTIPAPGQVSQNLSTSTNKGAIAGGTVGGVVGFAAIMGLLWWARRHKLRTRGTDREKIEIDPSGSTSTIRSGAPPNSTANLAVPSGSQNGTRELRNEGISGALAEPIRNPPRYWQVHNSSLPSLQQQEILPEKLALSINSELPLSSGRSHASAPLSTTSTIGHSPLTSEGAPESPDSTENPFSESGFTVTSDPLDSESLSTTHLTRATSLGSASVALSTESEVLQLRRQVELLTQENARLAEDHAEVLRAEAPPAYDEPPPDDEEEEEA